MLAYVGFPGSIAEARFKCSRGRMNPNWMPNCMNPPSRNWQSGFDVLSKVAEAFLPSEAIGSYNVCSGFLSQYLALNYLGIKQIGFGFWDIDTRLKGVPYVYFFVKRRGVVMCSENIQNLINA